MKESFTYCMLLTQSGMNISKLRRKKTPHVKKTKEKQHQRPQLKWKKKCYDKKSNGIDVHSNCLQLSIE